MAVEISKVTEKAQWVNSGYTWGTYHTTWAEAQTNYVTANVDAGGFTVTDSSGSTANFSRTPNEEVAVSDVVSQIVDFNRSLGDKVTINDSASRQVVFARLYANAVKVADEIANAATYKRSWLESADISDTYWDNIAFGLNVIEQLKVLESNAAKQTKTLQDKFSVLDKLKNKIFLPTGTENISLSDDFKSRTDFILTLKNALKVSEVSSTATNYNRTYSEDMPKISDQEWHTAIFRPLFAEILTVAETYQDRIFFDLDILESVATGELLSNVPSKSLEDAFGITSDEVNGLLKLVSEDVELADAIKSWITVVRDFVEGLSVEEVAGRHVTMPTQEKVSLYEAMIKACEGVLSDIIMSANPMDLEKFKEMIDAPPLYYPFIDFKVGEYDYKDALVKIKMRASVKEAMPTVLGCEMHVDIPDTDDRGVAEITDTEQTTKVYFNKFYYNPPEVTVSLRNGNTGVGYVVPNIISTEGQDGEGRYFEVELLTSSGTRTTGTISWASKGY